MSACRAGDASKGGAWYPAVSRGESMGMSTSLSSVPSHQPMSPSQPQTSLPTLQVALISSCMGMGHPAPNTLWRGAAGSFPLDLYRICSRTPQLQGCGSKRFVAPCPALPGPIILMTSGSPGYFASDGEMWEQPREEKGLESKSVQCLGTSKRV